MTIIMKNQKYHGKLEQHRPYYDTNKWLSCFNTGLSYTQASFKNSRASFCFSFQASKAGLSNSKTGLRTFDHLKNRSPKEYRKVEKEVRDAQTVFF